MMRIFAEVLFVVFVTACFADASDSAEVCVTNACDETDYVAGYVENMIQPGFANNVSVGLLQHKARMNQETQPRKCQRRCHYHPKHDCRLICRIQCVTRNRVLHPKCGTHAGTTTTTTSHAFSPENPPSKDESCNLAATFTANFGNLKVNTLGMDVQNPRLVFKNVVTLSDMNEHMKNNFTWTNRQVDLTITDASQKPRYVNTGKNHTRNAYVADPWNQNTSPKKFVRGHRNYTGTYLQTIRIGIDQPGSYVFRLTFTDSQTGELVPLPLVPLTFYDIDGEGEAVATCDAANAIYSNSKLIQTTENGCFVSKAQGREVNIPKNFEDLTKTQAAQSVTYVYANMAEWDVQVHLSPKTPQRYFVMKSSKVLVCSNNVQIANGTTHQWKNPHDKEADA